MQWKDSMTRTTGFRCGDGMKNLKVWQKLLVLGAVLSIPVAVFSYQIVLLSITSDRPAEVRGLEYCALLLSW